MRFVERLLGIKGETVRIRLVSLIRAGKADALEELLEDRFKIPKYHRSEFHRAIVVGLEFEAPHFVAGARNGAVVAPKSVRQTSD